MNLRNITPQQHQLDARDAVLAHFLSPEGSRATIILPCGTGKTLVGAMLDEALAPKTLLLLFPSLALIKQTLDA